jgi:hypothetical protein
MFGDVSHGSNTDETRIFDELPTNVERKAMPLLRRNIAGESHDDFIERLI